MTSLFIVFVNLFCNFNSHARVGRDPHIPAVYLKILHFNSHARVGRDGKTAPALAGYLYFNSHARVGRDR